MRSIAFRLIIAFCCIVTLLVCQGTFAYYSARKLASAQRSALNKEMELLNIHKGLSEARLTVYRLLGTMNPYQMDALKDEFNKKMSRLTAQFNKYGISTDLLKRNKRTYDDIIRYQYDFSVKLSRSTIDNKSKTQHDELTVFLKNEIGKIERKSRERVRAAHQKALFFTVGMCFLALLVSFVWAFLLADSLTDRKRAEAALREQYDFLDTLINTIPNPVFYKDSDGRYMGCNKAFERYLGKSKSMIVGKTVYDLSPRELAEKYDEYDRRLLRSPGSQMYESEVHLDTGEVRNVIFNKASILDTAGKAAGVVGVVSDITERKRAEENLARQTELLNTILNNIPFNVFWKNGDSVYLGCNKAFADVTGIDGPENIVGKTDYDLPWKKEESDFYRACDQKVIQSGMSMIDVEEPQTQADGLEKTIITSKVPLKGKDGSVFGILGIYYDITERKQMEEVARQTQKMEAIGTLAGGIAHDFNNILGGIIGYVELAQEDVPAGSSVQQDLAEVLRLTTRAKNLVKQILTFSRRSQEPRRPLQVASIVKEAVKLIRATVPTTIDIVTSIQAPDAMVNADPTQIHQVVMNLCTNAAYAMQENGGVLDVVLSSTMITPDGSKRHNNIVPGPFVMLKISDTGIGMNSEIMDHIFEPFFTTKEKEKGTGMGLAVVHGIVREHGGDITVTSQPGKGATFTVLLPQVTEMPAEEESDEAMGLPGGNEHVLFVDDEKMLMDSGKRILELLGYRVTAVNSSTEALAIFRQSPECFDLLITDQTMPRMTGYKLAKHLMEINPRMPVILCTGYSDTVTPEKAAAAGIKALIYKPVNKEELARNIRKVLEQDTA